MLENLLITGLINGGVYALLAIGFSLSFGVAKILNLSHTAFYMVGAYLLYFLSHSLGYNPVLSILITLIFTSLLGVVFYKLFINPVREHETTVLIMTIAIALLLEQLIFIFFRGQYLGVAPIIPGNSVILGVVVRNQYLITFGVVLATLVGIWFLLMKTRLGIAIRSAAQDREIANLMGMDVAKVATYTIAISIFLAALAGAMVAPIYVLEPHMWLHPLIIVLAIVVLGGLGSIKGSFIGAFILAYAETAVVFLLPGGAYLKIALALGLMVIILLVRPEGLFGIFFEGER